MPLQVISSLNVFVEWLKISIGNELALNRNSNQGHKSLILYKHRSLRSILFSERDQYIKNGHVYMVTTLHGLFDTRHGWAVIMSSEAPSAIIFDSPELCQTGVVSYNNAFSFLTNKLD